MANQAARERRHPMSVASASVTAANLDAFVYLWGADTSGLTGPNTGLVEVNGNTVAASGRLWAFAGHSRFIRPGAVRIGTTTSAKALM